jgi:hypothetical protein
MFTTIAIIAGVIILIAAAILIIAATKPGHFRVQRSIEIHAAPGTIFPLINDLHANSRWSPFEKDPNMKKVHSGAPQGVGAAYDWDGNRQVGRGRIAIVESVPTSKVVMKLDMFTPFEAHNTVEFTLHPGEGNKTTVTWAMFGPQPFMAKVMSTIVDCDKMVGKQFEEGLGKMKAIAEAA